MGDTVEPGNARSARPPLRGGSLGTVSLNVFDCFSSDSFHCVDLLFS